MEKTLFRALYDTGFTDVFSDLILRNIKVEINGWLPTNSFLTANSANGKINLAY